MIFETDIENDNYTYKLSIATNYIDNEGLQPETIDISIEISKIVGDEEYRADSMDLIYNLKNRAYQVIMEAENIELHDSIIEKLDSTYGHLWGYDF